MFSPVARIVSFVRNLPRAVLGAVAVLILALLAAAAVYGYRVYDYVQHDNDFCLSCHLMVDPYERFAQSDHRGLGCKACHQPTPAARAQMGLTQIIRNPSELEAHAEVPNERCEACHVKGNPSEWTIISQSAGHRVHLESNSPSLSGLQCVQCHSSSVHEFTTTDKTCGQSGCHENVTIQLGKMSKLTLHCAVCHDFTRPVAQSGGAADTIGALLRPQAQECLSCHAMRLRMRMPEDDPHNGACAACHNPHPQTTPAEAVRSCANSGCHEAPEKITPMHKGLSAGGLADCTTCHRAHEFRITTQQCAGCHVTVAESPDFQHTRHRSIECAACHAADQQHGELRLAGPQDCQSCHHTSQVAANCTSCHRPVEFQARAHMMSQRLTIATATHTRELRFDHAAHENVACAQCHREPMTRSAAGVQCMSCHVEHHKPAANCMACHTPPPAGVHNRNVHVSCSGSSCHKQLPVAGIPHTRQFCLSCHQTMVEHRAPRNCADCHKLPAPRGASQ
jgi:nitrate/TMAO reductase-like tetraheme cytochrome c subunit